MSQFCQRIAQTLRHFPARFLETVKRFSGTVVLVVLFYLLNVMMTHTNLNIDPELFWMLGLGAILLLAADLFFEARPLKWYWAWGIKVAMLLLLALTYTTLLRHELRPILLLVASIALFGFGVCTNYKARAEETLGVLIVRGATALLFAGVLFAGIALILAGTDLLLFSVHSTAFGEAARFSFMLFAPLMFLYGIPKAGEEKTLLRGYQQLLKVVILPLLGVFMAVLYCYYIKLAVTWELPISELGGVSLAFLCINLPMVLLAKPFCEGAIAKLRQILLYGTFPVFVALFFTAGRQVVYFGVSVTRYIVLVGGLALLLCVLLMIFKKYRAYVFVVLLVMALLASYGPQSCYSLTQWSQHSRLNAYLTEAKILKDGTLTPNPDAPEHLRREILSLLEYCQREDLDPPESFPDTYDYYENVADILGFDNSTLPEMADNVVWHHYPVDEPVDLGDGSYLLPRGGIYNFEASCGTLKVDTSSNFIIICNGEVLCSLNQSELRHAIFDAVMQEDVAASYIYTLETETLIAKIPFSYISEPDVNPYGDWDYAYIKVR